MSSRNFLLLAVALVIAGFTAFALRTRMQAVPANTQAAVTVQRILVAKKDIPAGSFVRAGQDLDWANWPSNAIQEYHIREGAEQITAFDGAVARRAMKAGEAVMPNALIKPGAGGFLSAVLEQGKRAVSIAVTATSGNAGFIFPGDRVDLIVTHKVKVTSGPGGEAEEAVISETFVENVRVVAVDQKLDNPENKALLAKTVTVEATPKQAEKIQVATELGKVSFSLRSLSDSTVQTNADGKDLVTELTKGEPQSFTRDFEVSPSLERSGNSNARIRVIRGDQSERLEFYGGAQ